MRWPTRPWSSRVWAWDKEEPLASEWALIVPDGARCIALVADDIHDTAPGEQTLESARLFTASWSFSPMDAAREAITPTVREGRLGAVTELMVASINTAQTRSARVGEQLRRDGDEFLVVLPGLDETSGVRVGERIVRHLATTHLTAPWESLSVSASVGVAEAEPNRIPLTQLDEALYRVKRSGKGHVCLVTDAS